MFIRGTAVLALAAVFAAVGMLAAAPARAEAGQRHPVLLISVDGMRPGDVLDAKARGLKLPTLQAMMAEGAFARSVKNVTPTVTMPNHASLITGVPPAEHGAYDNVAFDPQRRRTSRYFWYAKDLRVPTLWDAVKSRGGVVASLNWPGTVGADSIDDNVPQYWRDLDDEDLKQLAALSTPRLVTELEAATGATLSQFIAQSPEADQVIGRFAAHILRTRRPTFFSVHLTALDHAQHVSGLDSPEARAALENTDAVIGRLTAEGRKAMPDLIVAVVSDHGFVPVRQDVNVLRAFVDAGLIKLDGAGQVADWQAQPWGYASAAVFLRRPGDAALRRQVASVLQNLAADPQHHIRKVIDVEPGAGADPEHAPVFYFDFEPGYQMGQSFTAPLLSASRFKATHGYLNDLPEMNSAFFMTGPSVPRGRDLGPIDMLDIGPTVARRLGVSLDRARGKPLF